MWLADSVLLGRMKPSHKQKELQVSHVKPLDTVNRVCVCVWVCVWARVCVCLCPCVHMAQLFFCKSVLFLSMQLIVLWLCQPKAVKNTQPNQMRCNLFVSLQACKVEPCEAKASTSTEGCFHSCLLWNNCNYQYSSDHISNLITSFRHCFLIWCGPMSFFLFLKRLNRHEHFHFFSVFFPNLVTFYLKNK